MITDTAFRLYRAGMRTQLLDLQRDMLPAPTEHGYKRYEPGATTARIRTYDGLQLEARSDEHAEDLLVVLAEGLDALPLGRYGG